MSSTDNTPKPIRVRPISIAPINNIARIPVIIKKRVIRVSNRHNSPGILKHLPKQPITSNRMPATITPTTMNARGKPVASR